jgi:hypothetical protein
MSSGLVITSAGKPWFVSGANIPPPQRPKAVKKIKDRSTAKTSQAIIHPIFVEAAKYVEDTYWISILGSMACGKMPRTFKYIGCNLTHKLRNRTKILELDEDDPEEVADGVIDFLQIYGGIMSPTDKERRDREIEEKVAERNNIKLDSWTQINSISRKILVINDYVDSVAKTHKLTKKQKSNLSMKIRLGLTSGYITPSSIKIEDGVIVEIDGLEYDEKNGIFHIDLSSSDKIKKSSKSSGDDGNEDELIGTNKKFKRLYNTSQLKGFGKFLNGFGKRISKQY